MGFEEHVFNSVSVRTGDAKTLAKMGSEKKKKATLLRIAVKCH